MESIVYIKAYNTPEIDKKEILRYAGIGEADGATLALLDGCIAEAEGVLSYKLCYACFPITVDGENIDLGFTKTRSHSLALCLSECDEIVAFCATCGGGLDRLIKKCSITSPSRAVMLQAIGSERVEALCDVFCCDIAKELGREVRPRFSPGYGDLALEVQRALFSSLDCARKIGVSLGENLFMTPTKSVTAIIGVKRVKQNEN